jgi:hypothetical protein
MRIIVPEKISLPGRPIGKKGNNQQQQAEEKIAIPYGSPSKSFPEGFPY